MTSLIHRLPFAHLLMPRLAARADAARRPSGAARAAIGRSNSHELEELRGAAMRRLFPKLYSWCSTRMEWSRTLEVHAYLAGATSVEDLERRIRTVEQRSNFRN